MAAKLGVQVGTASKWRNRFLTERLEGVLDEPRPRRPRTVVDEKVEAVITRTYETTPQDATRWSTRSLAAELCMSQSAVSRIWRAFGVRPHRQDTWKLSKDPSSSTRSAMSSVSTSLCRMPRWCCAWMS